MGPTVVIGALVGASLAACPEPIGAVQLAGEVSAIELAWSSMDADRIYEGEDRLLDHVPCLSEAVPPTAVVEVFRALALTRYVVGDRASAAGYLRSVRAVAPGYALSETLVGLTHPLRGLFDASAPQEGQGEPRSLALPAVGWLQVDGLRASVAPVDRPFLFQHLDELGRPLRSDLLQAGEAPIYEIAPPSEPPPRAPRATSRALLAAGLGTAAASGLALAAAGMTRDRYQDTPTWEPEQAARLKRSNLALGVGGYALAAVGAGLGVAALVEHRW